MESNIGSRLGPRLLRIAAVYLVAGLMIGLAIGVTKSLRLATVHTHVLMLGWAVMSVIGIVYMLIPSCGQSKWALVHLWLHNTGLPVMMAGLTMEACGRKDMEPLLAAGSVVVFLSLAAFAVSLLRAGSAGAAGQTA